MMSHKVLNSDEEATYERVWEVAEKNWAHVTFKIRLRDAIPVKPGDVSYADFSFALKAHLDVLVTDAEYHPLFAVEFDGPRHETDMEQQRRDRQKNALMKRFGLPLLRIKDDDLNRKYRGFDLLSFFSALWFWCDSYVKPIFPDDVDAWLFDHPYDAIWAETQIPSSPYYLSWEVEERIKALFKTGQVASRCLNYWIGGDAFAGYRCIMWVLLAGGRCCFVERSMRPQQFPVPMSFILAQITAFHLFDQIQSVICGESAARTIVELQETLDYHTDHSWTPWKISYSGICQANCAAD
jgi:hypothetical protein